MAGQDPSPQTTLLILLGASNWPLSDLGSSTAFENAVRDLQAYFLSDPYGYHLPQSQVLDLFDSEESGPDILDRISDFLRDRIVRKKESGPDVRDVLLYFVGHGGITKDSSVFYLAIRRTRKDYEKATSIAIEDLAERLKKGARFQRRILILDCCFAAAAVRFLQGPATEVLLREKTIAAFEEKDQGKRFPMPSRGTSFLASSGQGATSVILPDETSTMFTSALLAALRTGDPFQEGERLPLRTVHRLTIDFLSKTYADNFPRPELHSPDQTEGKVEDVPFFPNPWIAKERLRREEERQRQAEKELAEDRLVALPEKNAPRPGLYSPDQSEGDVANVPLFPNARAEEERRRLAEEAKRRQVEVERQRITPYDRKAVIITTMAVEYNAVRAHIQNLREIDNGRILGETGHFAGNDATWDVIIFQVSQGNISMAAETERIINSLQPDIALLIDIADGTEEVRIGDVVVAEKVYGYESGKAWMSRLLTRPEVEKPSYSLLECARAEAGKLDWLRRLPKDFHGHFAPPRVLLAPIASGEKELSSRHSPLFRFLNAFYEDTLAIEMAGRGFLKAAPIHSREVEALVICGIARQVDARRQEQEMHLLHDFAPAQDGSTLAAQRASAFAFQVLAKLGPQATRERPKKSSELTIAGLLVNENEGLTALDITLSNQGEQSIVVTGIQIDVLDVGVFSLCTNPISSGLRAVNIASADYPLELFPALKGKSKTRYISHTLRPGEIELIRLYLDQNEDDPQRVYVWYYLKITLLSSQQPLETPQPVLLSIPPVNRAMREKVWFSGNSACDEPNRIILQRLATLPSIKSATVEDVIARF